MQSSNNDELEALISHYGTSIVKDEETRDELQTLLHASAGTTYSSDDIIEQLHQTEDFTAITVMKALVQKPAFQQLYPNLCILAAVGLVLPLSTVDCERGFSDLKLIKTPLRNRLCVSTLESLLWIAIEGPPLTQFDFGHACDLWARAANRRIDVQ